MKQHSRYQTARRILIFWTLFIGTGAVAAAQELWINITSDSTGSQEV